MSGQRITYSSTGRYDDGRSSGAYLVHANGRLVGTVRRSAYRDPALRWIGRPAVVPAEEERKAAGLTPEGYVFRRSRAEVAEVLARSLLLDRP